MSRIRSIHPGIWTDEEFVGLSSFARLLFIGIWNECDDKGLFVWSPLQLKMRVLPADNIDAAALLDELATSNSVRKYEIGGKSYGAVRNFAKFQRPKKPNDVHPASPQILAYAGHDGPSPAFNDDEVTDELPTEGVKSPQMEDEGGKRELGKEPDGSPPKRAEPFPRPDWAEPPLWADFLKNRKAKRSPNTATAHAKMMTDMARWSAETGWPPGEVFRVCVAKGWAGIYDPRDKENGNHGNNRNNPAGNGRPVDGFTAALRHVANGPNHVPFGNDRH